LSSRNDWRDYTHPQKDVKKGKIHIIRRLTSLGETMLTQMKNYPKLVSADVRLVGRKKKEDGYEKQLIVFQTPFGYRRAAELFLPEGEGPFPAILYVH
jgi:hypothetical protein